MTNFKYICLLFYIHAVYISLPILYIPSRSTGFSKKSQENAISCIFYNIRYKEGIINSSIVCISIIRVKREIFILTVQWPHSLPQDCTLDNGFSFCEIFINLSVVVVKGFYIREYYIRMGMYTWHLKRNVNSNNFIYGNWNVYIL